jgi:hypothetical protein
MRLNGISSLLKADKNYQPRGESKIELLGCPYGGQNCKTHLALINNNYLESAKYQNEKNYLRAIELLKSAYYTTHELQKTTCTKCASLFRSTITNSMSDIHKELQKMSTGMFRNKRYHDVYVEAGNALRELNKDT